MPFFRRTFNGRKKTQRRDNGAVGSCTRVIFEWDKDPTCDTGEIQEGLESTHLLVLVKNPTLLVNLRVTEIRM